MQGALKLLNWDVDILSVEMHKLLMCQLGLSCLGPQKHLCCGNLCIQQITLGSLCSPGELDMLRVPWAAASPRCLSQTLWADLPWPSHSDCKKKTASLCWWHLPGQEHPLVVVHRGWDGFVSKGSESLYFCRTLEMG